MITTKNLDVLEQENQEHAATEALYAEVYTDAPGPDGERLFTKDEVRRIVAEGRTRERVNLECREYLLEHYYDVQHVTEEINSVISLLNPRSVEELAEKLVEVEALDHADEAASNSPRRVSSLRQIFGLQ